MFENLETWEKVVLGIGAALGLGTTVYGLYKTNEFYNASIHAQSSAASQIERTNALLASTNENFKKAEAQGNAIAPTIEKILSTAPKPNDTDMKEMIRQLIKEEVSKNMSSSIPAPVSTA
jgi:hypothetical protein